MSNKKKLLLVTYFFPPFNRIASKRWYEMLPELSKSYTIVVLTINSTGDLLLDDAHISKLHRVGQTVHQNSTAKEAPNKKSLIQSALSFFVGGMRTFDSTVISFYLKGRPRFDVVFKEFNPDLIITSVGPFSTALFGLRARKIKRDIYWVVDLRDSVSMFARNQLNFFKRTIDKWIDKYVITKADQIITVSPTLVKLQSNFYVKKVGLILNGFDDSNTIETLSDNTLPSVAKIYYAGKIYEHRFDALVILLHYLKQQPSKKLLVRLVNNEIRGRIQSVVQELCLQNVELLEPVSDSIYQAESKVAGYNLILEDISQTSIIGKGNLTAKLFNLLQYDPPILTIARNDSDIGTVLKKTGKGEICSSLTQLNLFFSKKREEFRSEEDMSFYSREGQAKEFMKLLKD